MERHHIVPLVLLMLCGCGESDSGPSYPLDAVLRLNHLQVKGTHNSFHVAPTHAIKEWDYTHAPLPEQLSKQGVRQFELDLYWNITDKVFEVYHLPTLDENTTCRRFGDCLKQLRTWSQANRGHLPLVVLIEPKDSDPKYPDVTPYTRMEKELLSVFARHELFAPDDLRGAAATVGEAIQKQGGWPTLGKVRGKLIVVLLQGGEGRRGYTHDHKDLRGRLMFITGEAGKPYTALVSENSCKGKEAAMQKLVKTGVLLRSRADSPGEEALVNDTARLKAALDSGAHFVGTDYPAKVAGIDYVVQIPGGNPARCNPLTAPAVCTAKDLENL